MLLVVEYFLLHLFRCTDVVVWGSFFPFVAVAVCAVKKPTTEKAFPSSTLCVKGGPEKRGERKGKRGESISFLDGFVCRWNNASKAEGSKLGKKKE